MTTEEAEFTDEETLCIMGNKMLKADLRVFGAIGFQDAPNGLWLEMQKYLPRESLLQRIVDSALAKGVNILGLTSEDDEMIRESPEDRFGLIRKMGKQKYISGRGFNYSLEDVEPGLMVASKSGQFSTERVYLINAETRSTQQSKEDWKGLKLQVVGGNCLRKDLGLVDTVNYANDRGFMTFLIGTSPYDIKIQNLADKVADKCTGVIGHDATNTFPNWMARIPKLGPSLKKHTRERNTEASRYAELTEKPSIAVSSAHWMNEIGRASIEFESSGELFKFQDLRDAIIEENFSINASYNPMWNVLTFGRLIGKHGGKTDRFAGDKLSSYNY